MDLKGIGRYTSDIGWRKITVAYEHGNVRPDSIRVGEFHV